MGPSSHTGGCAAIGRRPGARAAGAVSLEDVSARLPLAPAAAIALALYVLHTVETAPAARASLLASRSSARADGSSRP